MVLFFDIIMGDDKSLASKRVEKNMFDPILLFIIGFCISGCGWSCWKIGHSAGIEHALAYLHSEGIIEFEPEDDED